MPIRAAIDFSMVRTEFPMLNRTMNGHPLCYLDFAATTQKPEAVLDAMNQFYKTEYATVNRGIYELSQVATERCQQIRMEVGQFLNGGSDYDTIFTRGATDAINLVAYSYPLAFCRPGDAIIVTEMEHHANLIPWQQSAKRHGLELKIWHVTDSGDLDLAELARLITPSTRLVAVTHCSNALGTVNPIKTIGEMAHAAGAHMLVDAAQTVAHQPIDLMDIQADFLCFSGHKMYGPTGIGILMGRSNLLNQMPPVQFGGDMIESVGLMDATFARSPQKFEAGTPSIVEIIGLGAAIKWLNHIGMDAIQAHESALYSQARAMLAQVPHLQFIGNAAHTAGAISFILDNIHAHDVGTILDTMGIAVRVGHHCTQPLMRRFGVPATVRASIGITTNLAEINRLVAALTDIAREWR